MSEVPEGVNLPAFARKPPRPTVTLTLTRDGVDGVEVLLGRRAESMRAFPGYWAFPGGGVSRTDHEGEDLCSEYNEWVDLIRCGCGSRDERRVGCCSKWFICFSNRC